MNSQTLTKNYLTENGFEDIKGYEGLYKINPSGEVWNCKYKRIHYQSEKCGKKFVNLTKDGKVKKNMINKLLDIQKEELKEPEPFDLTAFEDIKNYEGLYKINRNGDIWSCCYKKIMKPQEKEDGYLCVNITRDDGKHKGYIHRLLAIQYIENPDNLPEVDHIDRNRQNNCLDNLRWVDKKTQNNNKKTNIASLTEEEQQKRILDIREYKRVWAENDRRKKGINKKITFENEEEKKEHQLNNKKEWLKQHKENMTEEQREIQNEKQRIRRQKRIERMTPTELEEFRKKEAERTRRCNEKNKELKE